MANQCAFDVELFVEEIRLFPFLFDTSNKNYKDFYLKNNRWAIIAAQFGITKEVAKIKWKGLRDRYARERKMYLEKMKSGSGSSDALRPKWQMYVILESFLEPLFQTRSTTSLVLQDAISICTDDFENSDLPITSKSPDDVDLTVVKSESLQCMWPSPSFNVTAEIQDKDSSGSLHRESKRMRTGHDDDDDDTENQMAALLTSATDSLQRLVQRKRQVDANDEAYHYFTSLMRRFLTLTAHQQRIARFRIENIMYEVVDEDE